MSSQQGPKAAPGQHSAHILLVLILREHQSTSANFLGDVGEGERERSRFGPRRRSDLYWVGYKRCGNSNMRPSCTSSRLETEAFQVKSVRLPPKSSSAWPYFSILQQGDSRLVKNDIRPVATR